MTLPLDPEAGASARGEVRPERLPRLLFLDDDEGRRERFRTLPDSQGHEVDYACSYAEAQDLICAHRYEIMHLDHDLCVEDQMLDSHQTREKNGLDVVRHIVLLPAERRPRLVIVHSFNRRGAQNMIRALAEAGIEARHEPFDGVSFG